MYLNLKQARRKLALLRLRRESFWMGTHMTQVLPLQRTVVMKVLQPKEQLSLMQSVGLKPNLYQRLGNPCPN
jgi:hypothetical protein